MTRVECFWFDFPLNVASNLYNLVEKKKEKKMVSDLDSATDAQKV